MAKIKVIAGWIALILGVAAFPAMAETVTISCDAPTTFENGLPLAPNEIQGYEFRVDDGVPVTADDCSWTSPNLPPGTYSFQVRTLDVYGLVSRWASAPAVIDRSAPNAPTSITITILVTIGTP